MPEAAPSSPRARRYERETLEFDRIAFFSDAIFAIALTLLVTGLDVPEIVRESDANALWTALGNETSGILMFFISVAVIGSFWLRHHGFVRRLAAMDSTVAGVSLVYLGFVAFLPFPSAVLGAYTDNSVSVTLYAGTIIVIAATGNLLEEIADRHALRAQPSAPEVVKWRRVGAAMPIVVFAASIVVAFAVSGKAAVWSWLLLLPLGQIVQRMTPADVEQVLQG